jgi:hyperosmotically inducible protein
MRFLLGLVLIISVTGCAGTKVSESTGEFFDDSFVTTKVKSTFLADSRLKVLDITVTTFKGAVQLSGFVDSKAVADRAVQVARTVKGVKVVNNSLVVK